jgi:hypothetical protein
MVNEHAYKVVIAPYILAQIKSRTPDFETTYATQHDSIEFVTKAQRRGAKHLAGCNIRTIIAKTTVAAK